MRDICAHPCDVAELGEPLRAETCSDLIQCCGRAGTEGWSQIAQDCRAGWRDSLSLYSIIMERTAAQQ